MSTARATKRPNGKTAPAKARQAPPTRARAAPEKNSTLLKNAGDKPARYKPVNAGKGRVKGVPNAVTKSAREMFSAFIEGNAEKVQELWDRVARKSPAKALSIYAKLAEFVIPKLQRTELSGELNHHGLPYTGPVEVVSDPIEASRVYQEIIQGKRPLGSVEFSSQKYESRVAEHVYQEMVKAGKHGDAPARKPAQDFLPAARPEPAPAHRPWPEKRLRPRESVREDEPAPDDAEGTPTNVVVLEPLRDQHEHRPIADSKCAWCRKLWVMS